MIMTLLVPNQFNERFTLYVGAGGQPTELTLREMTAAQVMQAMNWHWAESDRLDRENRRFDEMAVAAVAGTLERETSDDLVETAILALHHAGEMAQKAARLTTLIRAAIQPQWDRHPGMGIGEAVRRFWPEGADHQ
jgi:hypothetical protein